MIERPNGRFTAADAETLATEALAYLAQDPEYLGRFLALSGIGPADIRKAAAEPGFLTGVLEFYLDHEPLLVAFCSNRGMRPTLFAAARYALAGHDRGNE